MSRVIIAKPMHVLFLPILAVVIVVSGLLTMWTPLRLGATIILFIPLVWGFLTLPLGGMIVVGSIIAVVRIGLEVAQMYGLKGHVAPVTVAQEAIFPILLYLLLGVQMYLARVRQAKLTQQLIESRTQEARGQVARRLSHDFSNIMSVIAGTSEMLSENSSLDERAARDVQTIIQATKQGNDLITQARNLSRAHYGRREVRDLSQTVEQHMLLVERVLPFGVRTVRSYAGDPLPVLMDIGELLRLLMNLCMNARDAMPRGGTLTVRTEKRGGDQAVLIVSDTGVGIPPTNMQRIFEPFFTTKSSEGGAGLGLSIAKSVVESHGGSIRAQSAPGSGTTFTLVFPLHQAAPSP